MTLKFTASLKTNVSDRADWWFLARIPSGEWFSYVYPNQWRPCGQDVLRCKPAYQGNLVPLNDFLLFRASAQSLPLGKYLLYFGVDLKPNGKLDQSEFIKDGLEFTIRR